MLIRGQLALVSNLVFIHDLVALTNKQVAFSNVPRASNSSSLPPQGDLTLMQQKVL
jgi:hypothetical protein